MYRYVDVVTETKSVVNILQAIRGLYFIKYNICLLGVTFDEESVNPQVHKQSQRRTAIYSCNRTYNFDLDILAFDLTQRYALAASLLICCLICLLFTYMYC